MRIDVEEGFARIQEGEVIAVATDTVFGLVASIKDPLASNKIYTIKERPPHKPLIIFISDLTEILSLIKELPDGASKLMKKHWPGALTLILPAKEEAIHPEIRAGSSTIGIRIPNCKETLALLRRTGPLASTSCNKSDHPAALSANEVEAIFRPDFPVLDSVEKPLGKESTIVSYENGSWVIKRIGAITDLDLNI